MLPGPLPMRCLWLLLLLVGGTCNAWDSTPHKQITKAALDTVPKALLARFGAETKPLIELYCLYPDRYQEMSVHGFVRKSEGPKDISEIAPYCERPDGEVIHGASGEWERDAGSLVYLFERILTSLSEKRPADAAQFAGVLSHFIEDSLSPPHAGTDVKFHGLIERSVPAFTLGARAPKMAGDHLLPAAKSIFDQIYAEAERNRADLPAITAAAEVNDGQALDTYRLRSGRRAAEILADTLFTLLKMSEPAPAKLQFR